MFLWLSKYDKKALSQVCVNRSSGHFIDIVLWQIDLQLSNSEEQPDNLYDIALFTLFSSPLGSVWVDLLSKLTLDLIDGLDLDKRAISDGYMYAY